MDFEGPGPIYKTVTLDPVRLYHQTVIDAHLMHRIKLQEMAMRPLEDADAYARRHLLRCFGRSGRAELSCPATWWEHLKATLQRRWPRLFGRLRVSWRHERVETGAVVADLEPLAAAGRMVIPYMLPPMGR